MHIHHALSVLLLCGAAAAAAVAEQSPARLSAAEDHARLMQELGIESLRRGADGDPASEHAANYDEALANQHMHSLPEVLRMDDGTPVSSAQAWRDKRRSEILAHYDREVYGRVPDNAPQIAWTVAATEQGTTAGKPTVIESLIGKAGPQGSAEGVAIQLRLVRPIATTGPMPMVLALTMDDETLALWRSRFTPDQWQSFTGPGPAWQEQVIERGWGYAELAVATAQADSGDGLGAGVIGLANGNQPRKPGDWGALRAWAWTASRALDYLEGREEFDVDRVALFGHSRYGKAALVAMAYDQRFAAAFISSSGEAGAKLWRRHFGEQVGNIAGSGEYHWMAGNFIRYAGPLGVDDLPVDQHMLVALCAPRPVFISSGTDGDLWVDPRGMFLAAVHAGPVYRLLGAQPLSTDDYPAIGTALTDGDLAWRQHELGHTPGPNWPFFLDFAAQHFASPSHD
jgi:hypothetical protein